MRTDEFLALPERERDAIVAEKVMGYDMEVEDPLPFYTTDIAAAWEVMEKMRKKYAVSIGVGTKCHVVVLDVFLNQVAEAWQPAPLAICLAALKAVGVIDDG